MLAWVSSVSVAVLFVTIGYPEQVNGQDHIFSPLKRQLNRMRDALFPPKSIATKPDSTLENAEKKSNV